VIVVPVASVISTGNPHASSVWWTLGPPVGFSIVDDSIVGCALRPGRDATPPTRAVVTSKAIAMTYLFRIASTTTLVQ